jgi:hypothetical protein
MEFLFSRNYECLEECDTCLPCRDEEQDHDPCFNELSLKSKGVGQFLDQVNELYCWEAQYCDEYRFRECEERETDDDVDDDDIIVHFVQPAAANTHIIEKVPYEKKLPLKKEETEKKYEDKSTPYKTKAQLINSRMARYRTTVEQVLKDSGNNTLADKVHIFLKDPQPRADRLSQLLDDIIRYGNKEQETGKTLDRKQVFDLLQNSICYYLDKVCFNGKELERISSLNEIFEELRKEKTDMTAVYYYWEPDEIKKYESGLDLDAIKHMITK